MKALLEPGELLILSYGMGIYRINSINTLTKDSDICKMLEIEDILPVEDSKYIAFSSKGHLPSQMELAIQETEDFRIDQKFVIDNGTENMKNRFYRLFQTSVVG